MKDASRTKYESISLAVTVLEMPTISIVKSLEPLRAINWTDARPWIAMLGAVILFLGWDLRKKRREIQKLDVEIAQLRSQQSLVRVATIHEMNSLIKDVEEISARKLGILGVPSPLEDFGIRFREFPVLTVCEAVTRRVVRVGRVSKRSVAFCRSPGSRQVARPGRSRPPQRFGTPPQAGSAMSRMRQISAGPP